jgi:hypothetical protein
VLEIKRSVNVICCWWRYSDRSPVRCLAQTEAHHKKA